MTSIELREEQTKEFDFVVEKGSTVYTKNLLSYISFFSLYITT